MSGFRSLTQVSDIPVSEPTILAGHNDGGKTALLDALSFLLGVYKIEDDDRTYAPEDGTSGRCQSTEVEGVFRLDDWEQTTFELPASVRIRRKADRDLTVCLELWTSVPDDTRLRDLTQYKAPELRALVQELGLSADSPKRADSEAALRAHAREHASESDWLAVPAQLERRLPRLLVFDGKAAKPDDAVKTALVGRFQAHVADETLQGRVQQLEDEVKDRLRTDAKSLCDHIRSRCPDLADVSVEPEVSFTQGFRSAPLRIARTSGEAVSLDRSGLGSARRISLAIWEWTSDLLSDDNACTPTIGTEGEVEPSTVQTIVVYDEPDTHLDYAHQRKIMQLVREQSAIPHVNVVVATHSMNLIDGVDISDVVHLKLENGRTTVERLGTESHDAIDQYLGKIAASVGLRNSVLLHERCFLAVEGETEQQAIPLLFRLCVGMSLQSAGIALWSCGNNEGALQLARYLTERGRTVMLVVDADSRNASKGIFKPSRLAQHFGAELDSIVKLLGEPDSVNELEELFGDELWARVANERWPRETDWTAADFAAWRGKKFSSCVQQMLQEQSETGPGGKPAMMYGLALSLRDPSEVPAQLRDVFSDLMELAGQ